YHAVRLGVGLRVMPQPEGTTWFHAGELPEAQAKVFSEIGGKFVNIAKAENSGDEAAIKAARTDLDAAAQAFVDSVKTVNGDYAPFSKINAEVAYNNYHPFRWAWVLYFLAMVSWSVVYFGGRDMYAKFGWALLGAGVVFHLWGLGLRVYILARPPVSNMYETVNWVALVALIFSAILYRFGRNAIVM